MYRFALLLIIVGLLVAACSSNDEAQSTAATPGPGVGVLFALQGEATLNGDQLVIEAEHVDWFTDRPERHAGRVTGETFAAAWSGMGFDAVPPNAFLTGGVSDTSVVLTEPQASETQISFTVSGTLSGDTKDGDLGSVGLFIDSTRMGFGSLPPEINAGRILTPTPGPDPTATPQP